MTPTALAEAVLALPGTSALRETAEALVFHAPLAEPARTAWLDLRDAPPACLARIYITDADGDATLERGMDPVPGERFRLTLRKTEEHGCMNLFFSASTAACLTAAAPGAVRIADLGAGEAFTTLATRFQAWTGDPARPVVPAESLADPRSFVKDFTGRGIVPADVRPWLLATAPAVLGKAFLAWRSAATERLLPALADQVSIEDGAVRYHFAGPPRLTMSPGPEEAASLADGVQAAATWVYAEGRDAEARHLLLAAEWARAHREAAPEEVGARSIESAKAAYAAFVRSGSKETLKAVADLRKGVVEETQKASQRAQDLSGALWKDLAVASAPFVLKVLPDSAKASDVTVSTVLAFGAAAFLAYSFGVQAYINHRYFKHQGESRIVWRNALNTVLSKDELEAFGEKPIRDGLADYHTVRNFVGIIYALLIAGLVGFACFEMTSKSVSGQDAPTRAPTDRQAPRQ